MPVCNPLKIEYVPLSRLKPWPRNPRRNDDAADRLTSLITAHGFVVPIIATPDGTIRAGHTRLKAAQKLGMKEVPVLFVDFGDEARAQAFSIADNKSQEWAEWEFSELADLLVELDTGSFDMEIAGFDAKEFEQAMSWVPEDELPDNADDVPELVVAVTKPGNLWLLGEHRLLCGNATKREDILRLMGPEVPDAVITDPPYSSGGFQEAGKSAGSIGTRSNAHLSGDLLSTRGYLRLISRVVGLIGADEFFVFTDWRMWTNTFDALEDGGVRIRNMLVWDKLQMGMGLPWRNQHELIAYGKRTAAQNITGNKGNVLQCHRTGNKNHPTQKPVDLILMLLRNTKAETVLDPFLGSGTTIIAAEHLNRKCYAMEIEPHYCDVAVKRWEQFTGKKAELAK